MSRRGSGDDSPESTKSSSNKDQETTTSSDHSEDSLRIPLNQLPTQFREQGISLSSLAQSASFKGLQDMLQRLDSVPNFLTSAFPQTPEPIHFSYSHNMPAASTEVISSRSPIMTTDDRKFSNLFAQQGLQRFSTYPSNPNTQTQFQTPIDGNYENYISNLSPIQQQKQQVNFSSANTINQRILWSGSDIKLLWEAIARHGNEWSKVFEFYKSASPTINVTKRNYHQVKDKGSRLLKSQNWKTGRLKEDYAASFDDAKRIAREVLEALSKVKSAIFDTSEEDDDTNNQGSHGNNEPDLERNSSSMDKYIG